MLTATVNEKASAIYTTTLKDEAGEAIPLADITALTLSLCNLDDPDRGTINSRSAQSILNVNGGSYHDTSGKLTLTLSPADNVVIDQTRDQERHLAEIRWSYNGGNATGSTAFILLVKNFAKVS